MCVCTSDTNHVDVGQMLKDSRRTCQHLSSDAVSPGEEQDPAAALLWKNLACPTGADVGAANNIFTVNCVCVHSLP